MTAETDNQIPSIFLPDFESMSPDELRVHIARTRRQLDRFDCLPGGAKNPLNPEDVATVRRLCDELEESLNTNY